jgi:hypothetical protein
MSASDGICAAGGSQCRGVPAYRVGLKLIGRELLQPCVLVGREHREGLAGQRQHFVAFEDDLILVLLESDAVARQFGGDLTVAQQRCRLVVPVARHGGDAQLARQRRHQLSRPAVLHDETAAECAQGGVQFDDRCMDELDPSVGAPAFREQFVENFGVEHEDAPDRAARTQCVMQRRMIVHPQVTAKPHQSCLTVLHCATPEKIIDLEA